MILRQSRLVLRVRPEADHHTILLGISEAVPPTVAPHRQSKAAGGPLARFARSSRSTCHHMTPREIPAIAAASTTGEAFLHDNCREGSDGDEQVVGRSFA
jgi:hypothetical protein